MTAQDQELARRVYSYFIFRLRQPREAERLTRLTFERVRREARRHDDPEEDPYRRLFAAARQVIASNPRRRGATRLDEPSIGTTHDPDAPGGISNEVALAIGRLHGREREVIALRFGAGLGVAEIAELIDRKPQDVKQRLARGVRSLAELGLAGIERRRTRGSAQRPGAGRAQKSEGEQRKTADQRRRNSKPK